MGSGRRGGRIAAHGIRRVAGSACRDGFGTVDTGQGASLHFHSLKERFEDGIPEVADFVRPG